MSSKSFFIFALFFFALNSSYALVDEVGDQDLRIAGILDNCSQKDPLEQGRCYEDSLRALLGLDAFDPEALVTQLDERAQVSPDSIEFSFRTSFDEWSFTAATTGEILDRCYGISKPIFSVTAPVETLEVSVNGHHANTYRNQKINQYEFCKLLLGYGVEAGVKRAFDSTKIYVFAQIWRRNDQAVSLTISGSFDSSNDFVSYCMSLANSRLFEETDEYYFMVFDGYTEQSNSYYDSKHYWSNSKACERVGAAIF